MIHADGSSEVSNEFQNGKIAFDNLCTPLPLDIFILWGVMLVVVDNGLEAKGYPASKKMVPADVVLLSNRLF